MYSKSLSILWLAGILSIAASARTTDGAPISGSPAAAGLKTAVYAAKGDDFCLAGPSTLCLAQDRFSVEVSWTDFDDVTGVGSVLPFQSDDSGLLWFFNADNWEMLIKVLPGCDFNNHFWVFSAASTDVEYRLRVTDHVAGVVKEYFNPRGNAAAAITDTFAFPTCDVVGGRPDLLLVADPATIPIMGTAALTLIARDSLGNPAPGARMSLEATLGTVAPEVVTDANGEAVTLFTAGEATGRATITATLEGAEPVSVEVTILQAAGAEVLLFANPTALPTLGSSQVTLIARDESGIPLGAGQRIRLVADLGAIEQDVFTDDRGEATAEFVAGPQAGVGRVTAILDGSAPAHVELEIRDTPSALVLEVNPSVVHRFDDQIVDLTVIVLNAQGEPFPGALVRFSSDLPLELEPSSVLTDPTGRATSQLTVTPVELQGIPENGTFRVSAEIIHDGQVLTQSVFLTVLGAP
ncbi:MAG: Ig-like domain-containing protein [Acidobacteriota bacterium]